MKKVIFMSILIIVAISQAVKAQDEVAADSVNEITVSYRTRNNLLVIPFMINESLKVNLLMDPRCKTVILFGKRYEKILGDKRSTDTSGPVSYDNTISIGPASASNMPIVVVPNTSFFNFFTSVNGVIGSDFLSNYELIINKGAQTVTIRSKQNSGINLTTRVGANYTFTDVDASN